MCMCVREKEKEHYVHEVVWEHEKSSTKKKLDDEIQENWSKKKKRR